MYVGTLASPTTMPVCSPLKFPFRVRTFVVVLASVLWLTILREAPVARYETNWHTNTWLLQTNWINRDDTGFYLRSETRRRLRARRDVVADAAWAGIAWKQWIRWKYYMGWSTYSAGLVIAWRCQNRTRALVSNIMWCSAQPGNPRKLQVWGGGGGDDSLPASVRLDWSPHFKLCQGYILFPL